MGAFGRPFFCAMYRASRTRVRGGAGLATFIPFAPDILFRHDTLLRSISGFHHG